MFQEMILRDPAKAFSILSQDHARKINQLGKSCERIVILETPGLLGVYRVQVPFFGIVFAYCVKLYAGKLFFDTIILNSTYIDRSSLEGLSDTLTHEIHHLDEGRNDYLAETFDPSQREASIEDEMKFQERFPSKTEVRREDDLFRVDFGPVLPAVPLYYIQLGAFLFVTKNLDQFRNRGTLPMDEREQSRGEEETRVMLAAREKADELYGQKFMFLSQHQEDIEGFPFCDLLVHSLEYLKSMSQLP